MKYHTYNQLKQLPQLEQTQYVIDYIKEYSLLFTITKHTSYELLLKYIGKVNHYVNTINGGKMTNDDCSAIGKHLGFFS